MLAAATGAATSVWQVGLLRAGAWAARGLRVPARNALLADAVPPAAYGRAYGFERMMDNLGAILGPLLALGLVAVVGVRWAIGLSVIPGLLAAAAIVHAIRHTRTPGTRDRVPLRIRIRPVLTGQLGRLLGSVAAFEVGNVAATLPILRATELLAPAPGTEAVTTIAIGLYVAYNAAATIASVPAGRVSDRLGTTGPVKVLAAGVAAPGASCCSWLPSTRSSTGSAMAPPPAPTTPRPCATYTETLRRLRETTGDRLPVAALAPEIYEQTMARWGTNGPRTPGTSTCPR